MNDDAVIGALFGIAFLTVINVCVISYSYGRLKQLVEDIAARVTRLEDILLKGIRLPGAAEGKE